MQILRHVNDASDWREVFSAYAGAAMRRQLELAKIVGDENWQIDFNAGEIYFGERAFKIQFIGSESAKDGTWLWGWENINGFDEGLLKLANSTRETGEQIGLKPLFEAQFELDEELNAHALCMVACTIYGRNLGYYACRHSGGCAYVALLDENLDRADEAQISSQNFVDISMQTIQTFELEHEIFIKSFLDSIGAPFAQKQNKGGIFKKPTLQIAAKFDNELVINFDDKSRIEGFKYAL